MTCDIVYVNCYFDFSFIRMCSKTNYAKKTFYYFSLILKVINKWWWWNLLKILLLHILKEQIAEWITFECFSRTLVSHGKVIFFFLQ